MSLGQMGLERDNEENGKGRKDEQYHNFDEQLFHVTHLFSPYSRLINH